MIVAAIDDTLLKLPGKLETPEKKERRKEKEKKYTHRNDNKCKHIFLVDLGEEQER